MAIWVVVAAAVVAVVAAVAVVASRAAAKRWASLRSDSALRLGITTHCEARTGA